MMGTLEATAPPSAERERAFALAAALVTVSVWASAFVGIRSASRQLSPEALALGRLSIASVTLGLLVLVRREPLPARRDLPAIAFCGVAWFGLYNISLNEAERRVDAGTAAMLVNIGPILIAVLAGILLHEGFPRRLLAGLAIAFLGTVLIGTATSGHGLVPSWGALLCVAAAVFYAVGAVAQKPLLGRVSALQVTWLACVSGALVCLPFAGTLEHDLPETSASAIGWMVYLAVVPMAIGFLTWGYALARTTAGQMGAMMYLVTPLAVLLGWLLLDEVPPALALVGGAICLAGVYVARRAGSSARSESMVSASSGRLSGLYRFTRAKRSVTPPG
jgi:drug/metabolite transporter (DMT)-like permease